MNVFQEMALSVYSLKSYEKFKSNKKGKVFLFGFLLLLIYFIITIIVPMAKWQITDGGLSGMLKNYVPDFELSNGRLWVEREVGYEISDVYFYINTSPDYILYDINEIKPLLSKYRTAVLMDSEKAIIKSKGEVSVIYFNEYPDVTYTRMDLMDYAPYIYLFFLILILLIFIFMGIGVFLGALIVAVIGMIVTSCMQYKLTFGQLYTLSLHTRTPSLLLKAILSFVPIAIPFFFIINFAISICYLAGAIHKLKEQNLQTPLEFTTTYTDNSQDWNNYN